MVAVVLEDKERRRRGPVEDQTGSTAPLEFYEDLQPGGESSGERLREMEPALSELFQSMREGAQVLTESRAEDTRRSRELCDALNAYTEWLDLTLELPPETIPEFYNVEKMFLSPKGRLVVVDGQGRVRSKALKEYPTEIVLTVVWNALPRLQSKINAYAERLGERIDLLDRISRELRSLPTSAEETPEES